MKKQYELSEEMISWLDAKKEDYNLMAIDNQIFPSPNAERIRKIDESPHSIPKRRALIIDFCNQFNMPLGKGVREAIRLIGEWQDTNKF